MQLKSVHKLFKFKSKLNKPVCWTTASAKKATSDLVKNKRVNKKGYVCTFIEIEGVHLKKRLVQKSHKHFNRSKFRLPFLIRKVSEAVSLNQLTLSLSLSLIHSTHSLTRWSSYNNQLRLYLILKSKVNAFSFSGFTFMIKSDHIWEAQ